ncbi:ATPase family gene 2 protein homolog A isoform X1 [Ciona intestinalis]
MSAKKRNNKLGWKQVGDEEYVLETGRSLDADLSFGDVLNPKDKHPNISNGVLCGQVMVKQIRDLKLPETITKSIVEINPQTMQLCGMHIGGPVILQTQLSEVDTPTNIALRSWPSSQTPLGKISMCEKQMNDVNCASNDFIFVSTAPDPIPASSVDLRPCFGRTTEHDDMFLTSPHFVSFLSQVLNKTYIVSGQKIEISYFGKPFAFNAFPESKHISQNKHERSEKSTATSNELSSLNCSLGNLKLNGNQRMLQNKSSSFISTSTPVKINKTSVCETSSSIDQSYRFCPSTEVFVFTPKTNIYISGVKTSEETTENKLKSSIKFDDIGGLEKQKQILTDIVIFPIKNPLPFSKAGVKPVRGILLCGPPGTGKSMLAKSVAGELNANMMLLRGTEVMSRFFGESEKQLNSVFDEARKRSPCIVVIDDVESLCPRRDASRSDVEKRIVASFISIMDALNSWEEDVVVIATTSRLESIDPALRRSGRFDREVDVGIPSSSDRMEILIKLLAKKEHRISREQMEALADQAHGYVGADLYAVCGEAGLHAVKRCTSTDDDVIITSDDVTHGLKEVPPSAMRELIIQVPKVHWCDIGGNKFVKKKLQQAIEWPLKNPAAFQRLGIDPPRGVLMYGPPGCSKTLTAKALATESGLNFISIKGPELFSKYVGDSERSIRQIFAKARSAAPAIIFFDELDALAIERGSGNAVADRVLAAMLTEMDGVEQRHDVIVVAATNRPDMIDKALLRPGRIDKIILVPLPDAETRREIFRIQFRKMPIADDVSMEALVAKTERYSGAEICSVCREAALEALDENLECSHVTWQHFVSALESVIPQTSEEKAKMYDEYGRTLRTTIR